MIPAYDPVLTDQWKRQQDELHQRLIVSPLKEIPRFVAGADMAISADEGHVLGVVLIYDRQENRIVEIARAVRKLDVPYVPGFLSFREGPVLIDAIGKLKGKFGAICFDGQGIAHPRRCGLASHVGITLDIPAIGVAKSRLIGTFAEPGAKKGSYSALMDKGEQIGVVLRTRDATNPVFVSVGHRVDLDSAIKTALACATKYRIPEPTRLADIEVAKYKRQIG